MGSQQRNRKKFKGIEMRALLVILNKDNASALGKCLKSIVNIHGLCQDFDVLIMDGASRDNSAEIAEQYVKEYPCIHFKVQDKLGGTGFARREACDYAIDNGYDTVVWGDSENEYSQNYMHGMMNKLATNDAVGGVPKVQGGLYAHAFSWYHAMHLVIPGLHKVHIPGNNKAEKVEIYSEIEYPPTMRSEDYGFSLLLRKKGIVLKQDIARDAVVYVTLPDNFRDMRAWQRARSKGVAQVLRDVGAGPWDNIAWSFIILFFALFALITPFSIWPLVGYSLLFFFASVWLFFRSNQFINSPRLRYFFAPMFGLLVYSFYSIVAVILFLKLNRK